jgi:hypothetical protein
MVRVARLTILLSSLWLSASASATTYYIAANGNDSNSGTSTSTPWLHAPAMTGCTANCHTVTIHAGDRFIFRGGDAWYYNGAGTPTGLPWVIYSGSSTSWPDGTAGNLDYIGVDHTWYNAAVCGSSWCRPIFSGGNPPSASIMPSCAHSTGTFIDIASIQYLQVDDIEFTGGCDSFTYISYGFGGSRGDYRILSNLHFHNFTASPATYGDAGYAMYGNSYSNANPHDDLNGLVCDNWDGANNVSICFFQGITNLRNSVIRNTYQGIVTNSALNIHDNLFEYVYSPMSQNSAHGNMMEWNTGYDSRSHYFYNNLIRHVSDEVNLWTCASPGYTDYYFNNVVWDNTGGNAWDVSNITATQTGNACGSSTGVSGFISNTLVGITAGAGTGSWYSNLVQNHMIGSNWLANMSGPVNQVNGTAATATTYGYTSANNYAPTSANCNGNQSASDCPVGKGANLASICSGMAAADAKAACLLDTTLGANYDTVNHRVIGTRRTPVARPTSGAWDAGAFQANTQVGAGPTAPSGLVATVQ